MNRTDLTEPSPPLLSLGDADAPACTDGFCPVPVAPEAGETPQ